MIYKLTIEITPIENKLHIYAFVLLRCGNISLSSRIMKGNNSL